MKPLEGKRILVTRPRAQAVELCDRLTAHGAVPIIFPTIEIAPLTDTTELDHALLNLARYDWIIFTSVNGVQALWERLEPLGLQALVGFTGKIAAIGPATAAALEQRGLTVNLIPGEYVAEAIVTGIGEVGGQRILLPRADIAREALAVDLQQRGATVDEIAAYRTLPAAPEPASLAELERGVDVITFTSSSTARNFVALAGHEIGGARIACLGPITARTVRELGLPVDIRATEYTLDGLVAALVRHFEQRTTEKAR